MGAYYTRDAFSMLAELRRADRSYLAINWLAGVQAWRYH